MDWFLPIWFTASRWLQGTGLRSWESEEHRGRWELCAHTAAPTPPDGRKGSTPALSYPYPRGANNKQPHGFSTRAGGPTVTVLQFREDRGLSLKAAFMWKEKGVSGRTHWTYPRSSQAQTSCEDQPVFSFSLLCTNRSTSSNAPSTLAPTS